MSHAKRRFGQNFLVDPRVIADIVRVIDPQPGQTMVEIGPGRAALTAPLLDRLGQLTAIEIDRDLHSALRARFGQRLHLIAEDVLAVDFLALGPAGLRVVGNLPYNISSPILFHLLGVAHHVADQTFMLQKEVVERMVAQEGSKAYGRLSIMLQARYTMAHQLDIPPRAFNPAPAVESAIVSMWPRPLEEVAAVPWSVLEKLVADAFSMRRKMLRNNLHAYRDRIDFRDFGLAETDRPEQVPVSAYLAMAQALAA